MTVYSTRTGHLELAPIPPPHRRHCISCPKGSKRKATHKGTADGCVMTSGCEWHMRAWLRDTLKQRRGQP